MSDLKCQGCRYLYRCPSNSEKMRGICSNYIPWDSDSVVQQRGTKIDYKSRIRKILESSRSK